MLLSWLPAHETAAWKKSGYFRIAAVDMNPPPEWPWIPTFLPLMYAEFPGVVMHTMLWLLFVVVSWLPRTMVKVVSAIAEREMKSERKVDNVFMVNGCLLLNKEATSCGNRLL